MPEDLGNALLLAILFGIGGWSLYAVVRSWWRDRADTKDEDADWAELDEKFAQLKLAGLWGDGTTPEAKAFSEQVDQIYNKWMNRHHGTIGQDYARYRWSVPGEQVTA